MTDPRGILECIGNTSLLPLRKIVPKNAARILLKIESENPTGIMKDRMAVVTVTCDTGMKYLKTYREKFADVSRAKELLDPAPA